jgi:hypothetical protein
LIANSVEEYVQIALALACNPGRLDELRRSLRPPWQRRLCATGVPLLGSRFSHPAAALV